MALQYVHENEAVFRKNSSSGCMHCGLSVLCRFHTGFHRKSPDQTEQVSAVYAKLTSSLLDEGMGHSERIAVFREVFENTSNPLIVMAKNGEPVYWANLKRKGLFSDTEISKPPDAVEADFKRVEKRAKYYSGKFTQQIIRTKGKGCEWGYLVFGSNPFIDQRELSRIITGGKYI
ncbi:MAG: hypothetical protein ACLFTW_13805 [Chitinispirillaceae bacterium]